MTLIDIKLFFDYIYWARTRVLDITDTLNAEQFTRDMKTSHRSIHETCVHMFGSEKLWLTRWQGSSPTGRERPEDYPTSAAVRKRWSQIESEVRSFLDGMNDADAQKIITYMTLEGKPVMYPWWNTAVQVTNHSSYHRGQIITMLRQQGVNAVGTDIIMYFKEKNK
ncbi:MAG TPA: DinB family protein [Candidatus Kapabacteria bacterium]|nr:DinB family protein [Candidatus Kapabacteria bacterium]